MQRIVAGLFDESLEGVVVDGTPVGECSGDFDLDSEFTLQCADGTRHKVSGWAVDIRVLES